MATKEYPFQNLRLKMVSGSNKATGVSRSSLALSAMIRNLKGKDVLDLGCGEGYMSLGALMLGARKVTCVDSENVSKALMRNAKINGFPISKMRFIQSDLLNELPKGIKFDAIIANLPQHALPATPGAKKLSGKNGGYDGTDLVCRAISEAAHYLKPGGRYYGSVSELTNAKRTMSIIKSLYRIASVRTEKKTIHPGEMLPFITDKALAKHLTSLKKNGLLFRPGNNIRIPVTYKVHRYELRIK